MKPKTTSPNSLEGVIKSTALKKMADSFTFYLAKKCRSMEKKIILKAFRPVVIKIIWGNLSSSGHFSTDYRKAKTLPSM